MIQPPDKPGTPGMAARQRRTAPAPRLRGWQRTAGVGACVVVSAALAPALSGCADGDAASIKVELLHTGPAGGAAASGLTLVAGGDRWYRNALLPGESLATRLKPGPGADRRLTLLFDLGGQRHEWESPPLPAAPLRVRLVLRADGGVEERHCSEPCALPG